MLALGTPAPPFTLPEPAAGRPSASTSPARPGRRLPRQPLPVRPARRGRARALGRDLTDPGVAMVAIASNDVTTYPSDPSDARRGPPPRLDFPYLFDATQDVARAYSAACTPTHRLRRRSPARLPRAARRRPRNIARDRRHVRAAVEAVLDGGPSTPTSGPPWVQDQVALSKPPPQLCSSPGIFR